LTRWLIGYLRTKQLVDLPNQRSSHTVPTPRGGGLGIVFGLLVGSVVTRMAGMELPGAEVLGGAALIAMLGFLDDRLDLNSGLRFLVQIGAAVLVAWPSGGLKVFPLPPPLDVATGGLAVPLGVVWIVGVVNIYNFLDGIDGYAGGQGFLAGLGLFAFVPALPQGGFGLLIAGACLGFLIHNWHPAKIFMGDVGSTTLGFLFAALPLAVAPMQGQSVFLMAMFLWFFLADGLYTLVRRARAGENVLKPHRTHLYQRWHQAGLKHSQVVLRVGAMAVPLALTALVATVAAGFSELRWWVVAQAVGTFVLYVFRVKRDYAAAERRATMAEGEQARA
jgi:UDP-N-acetylmuramyl pentapeptide phosphotransferase/UDP-N-acetylglucosamine-1-phosphate transferase